jgi:glutamate-1-semialdehyde 2,1-aminomutase
MRAVGVIVATNDLAGGRTMVKRTGEAREDAHSTGPPAGAFSIELSQQIATRARRVIWKGGKEATQHEALQACGFPRFLARSEGCKIWDVDGNGYIDYLMSWGTVLLGHGYAAVEDAVSRQLGCGSHFNLAIEQEVGLAERLVRYIPGAELVRFVATGAEATNAAVRIARAATGREKVIHYGFHGWLDWCQGDHPDGILPATLSALLSLEYNDLDALRDLFIVHGDAIACVIMEPVKDETPAGGFLAGIRDLVHHHGGLLIFDEAKTGFRFGLGGAQAHYGVTPDLCIFSKALANGYPLAVVAGREEVFERASGAWVSGTYHGWPPAIIAAQATLTELEREPVVPHVWALGERLMEGFNAIMGRRGLQSRLVGVPPMPQLRCPDAESATIRRLISAMLQRGYFIHPIRPWFLSYAHDVQCIDRTLDDLEIATRQAVTS